MRTSENAPARPTGPLAGGPGDFRDLLEVVGQPVIVVHRESGHLLAVNTAACRLYGYARTALLEMRYPDLATEAKSIAAIFSERREFVPLRYHRHADGRHFPVEMTLRWAGHAPDEYVFIALRDISERFQRERTGKSDGERYQALFHAAPYPLYVLNNRGIIVDANTAALERYGCDAAEMLAQHVSRFIDDERQAPRYYLSRHSFLPAQWQRQHDGSRFLADILLSRQQEAGGTQTMVTVRDITEERALLDRLKSSEERWRFALEGQGDGLWDWNLEARELIVSDDFREVLGLTATSLPDNFADWIERVHPNDRAALETALVNLLKGAAPLFDHHLRVRFRAGDYRWLALRGKVMEWNPQGRAVRIVGSVRDIEEETRRAERERAHHEQALHTARLISMGEIATALAHEINQPLTAICNFSAVALYKLKSGAPAEELTSLMQTISAQAMRAGQITHHIRSFVRKGKTALCPLDVGEIINGLLPLAEVQAKSFEAALSVELPGPLPRVLADRVQIEQVLLNLIRNGLEAMSETAPPRRLSLRAQPDERQGLRLEVADHGHGLPETMLQGRWEPFHSNKEDGLGMGLSICRSIIENHRGQIWAEAAPGGGTVFCFTLPLADGERNHDNPIH